MKYIRIYLYFLFILMVNPSSAIANPHVLGLAVMSSQSDPATFKGSCEAQKFNVINYNFPIDSILHIGSTRSDGKFAISNEQGLLMCVGDSVFGNVEKTKCVGPGAMFKRKWSKPVKLERGVNYSKALSLDHCGLIFIEDLKVSGE